MILGHSFQHLPEIRKDGMQRESEDVGQPAKPQASALSENTSGERRYGQRQAVNTDHVSATLSPPVRYCRRFCISPIGLGCGVWRVQSVELSWTPNLRSLTLKENQ